MRSRQSDSSSLPRTPGSSLGKWLCGVPERALVGSLPVRTLALPLAALLALGEPGSLKGMRLGIIRESMIYPDLGGLATEIRVEHGLS